MLARVESNLSMDILRREQERIGGVIRDGRLYPPIGPHLTALWPLEPASNLQRRWHVVQTEPQLEMKVAEELEKCTFDVFAPKVTRRISVNPARRLTVSRTVSRPMLPGYVFAGFDVTAESWERIHRPRSDGMETDGIRGVLRLITIGERPVPVLDCIIDRLREREILENDDVGVRRPKGPPITLKIATAVRIFAPFCFAGLFGFVTELNHLKGRIGVEIDIFGRKTSLWLTQDQVEAF